MKAQYFSRQSRALLFFIVCLSINTSYAHQRQLPTSDTAAIYGYITPDLLSHGPDPDLVHIQKQTALSTASLYRIAVSSALKKQYAVALCIFNRISGTNRQASRIHDQKLRNNFGNADTIVESDPADAADSDAFISTSDHQPAVSAGNIGLDLDSLLQYTRSSDQAHTADIPSRPVKIKKLLQDFHDHKKVAAYGLFIHIKQPVPGKRKRFKWFGSVGHSFITLIKYNSDGTHIERTFGFYPKKRFILQATPVLPWAPSDYKNDSLHSWDESLGTLITASAFHKIIRASRKFARKSYHLSHTNCTDFALEIAAIAGIQISQTSGDWPLGYGNDPGDTGQSILERKYHSTASNLFFICSPKLKINTSFLPSIHEQR